MNSPLTTLIDIMRLYASCNEDQDTIKIAPIRAILADICASHLPLAQIEQLADALVACAEGRSDTLPSLDAIEPALAGAEVRAKLVRASLALNELLALHYALRTGAGKLAHLKISGTYLFDYLQECYIDAAPGQPSVVLIGAWLPPQGEVKVRLNTNDRLLRQIDISYSADKPYPYFNLKLWSNSIKTQAQPNRHNWQQQDGSENDLTIWLKYSDNRGEIRTRFIKLPYTINTNLISISITNIANIKLRETNILDSKDNILITCLRVLRA